MEDVTRPLRWYRARRHKIEGAVIHCMGENIVVGDDVWAAWTFLDESPELTGVALSVHALIHPDGTVTRCVPDDQRANHAGHSRFGTLKNLNETFLGAEFLLPGEWNYADFIREMGRGDVGFTDEQYVAGGALYAGWMEAHDFDRSRIVGHSVVSGDDVRGAGRGKLDPGVGFRHGRLTIAIDKAQQT